MSFGFSVGDFIAGIELIIKIGVAMHDTLGSKQQYTGLLDQFRAFQYPLLSIKRFIKKHPEEVEENEAMIELARVFQVKIDSFLKKLEGYQTHLGPGLQISLKDKAKANVAKIKFAFFRSNDIEEWKQDLGNYSIALNSAITVALSSQMAIFRSEFSGYRDEQSRSSESVTNTLRDVAGQLNNLILNSKDLHAGIASEFHQQSDQLSTIQASLGQVQSILLQLRDQDTNRESVTVHTSNRLDQIRAGDFQTMQSIQELRIAMDLNFQRLLNTQPQRDPPITFEDAKGSIYRFYTDYVSSAEIFQSDLEARWPSTLGKQMIKNQQYILNDAHTGEVIYVCDPLEQVFIPGRVITMSMCFLNRESGREFRFCPGCEQPNKSFVSESTCTTCGLLYRFMGPFSYPQELPVSEPARVGEFIRVCIREYIDLEFDQMLAQYKSLQQQIMLENMEMQKAQAFWNPLESMAKRDATSETGFA